MHGRTGSMAAALAVLLVAAPSCSSSTQPAAGAPAASSSTTAPPPDGAAAPRSFSQLVGDVRAQARAMSGIAPGTLVYLAQGDDERVIALGRARVRPPSRLEATDTVMVASLTKTLVATVAMSLVTDGTVALSDPVDRWLPGVVPGAKRMTVADLLSMSSGLYSYDESPGYPGPGRLPAQELVSLVSGLEEPLAFRPGAKGMESNTNYAVLQLLLEEATGTPLAALLQERVLGPAHLRHTRLGGTPTAHGYAGTEDTTVIAPDYPSAAAGAVSTVTDLGRFLRRLTAGTLIDPAAVADMETERQLVDGDRYGLGLRIRSDLSCGPVYGQIGGNDGYVLKAWTVPSLDRTVVVVLTDGNAGGIAGSLADSALCD